MTVQEMIDEMLKRMAEIEQRLKELESYDVHNNFGALGAHLDQSGPVRR